jgi:sirohydrochlorin cobaltochelatase
LLEFQRPTIAEGWQALVGQGINDIVVAPLLLFAAGHARRDIPEIIAECAADSPGVRWRQARPLSRHRSVIELAVERIASCYAKQICAAEPQADRGGGSDTRKPWALVAVGRGSHDPCARSDMLLLGEVLARRLRPPSHGTAFYAMTEPRLPEVLDHVAAHDAPRELIVYPHLLFQGRLYEAIRRQVHEASLRHRDTRFHLTGYLGPEFAIAEALGDRAGIRPVEMDAAIGIAESER